MIKEITMPAGGQTTDVSTIGAWLVKKGDKVKRGDALLEIETDKATLTVESFAKGVVLALLAEEGDEVAAGTVIAYIGDESDMAEAEARVNGESVSQGGEYTTTDTAKDVDEDMISLSEQRMEDEYQPIDKNAPIRYVKAMPNAKLLAKEHGISLSDIAAYTEKDILKRQDVQKYMEYIADGQMSTEALDEETVDEIVPLTKMRKVIARRMTESAQTIPSFQITTEVDMTQCISFRKTVNGAKDDIKLSFNDILFKCMEAAIRKFPYINALLYR